MGLPVADPQFWLATAAVVLVVFWALRFRRSVGKGCGSCPVRDSRRVGRSDRA